ncbi:MAG TPA: hypothetical protein VJ951_05725 [Bacteroidales bacterium]|nr:hypothetical protein [Bacteroidales bacterium]
MGLDIKIPIGMMFVIFGIMLTIFGLTTSGDDMYNISLGKNINLFSGIGMFIFGAFMLIISDLVRKKKLVDEDALKDEVKS